VDKEYCEILPEKFTKRQLRMRIAILTAISGLTSKLENPKVKFDGVDYFAFVDHIQENSVWEQRKIQDFTLDDRYRGRRNAKIYKILPHLFLPDYDYYFWVDSTHEVISDPFHVIDRVIRGSDIALFKHQHRNCVYHEAKELVNLNYDHPSLIKEQIKLYKEDRYPYEYGLYELPCSIRKNTEIINTMNLMWWEIICKYSSRDQISLPYVLYKLGIKPFIMEGYANNGLYANDIMPQVRNKFY
jgi:hypothetical protein